jgi:multiple sugar transport system substrate-binding protein
MHKSTDLSLKGSTWGHERGFAPLLELNKSNLELFPCSVSWDIRSLKEFGDQSLIYLSNKYDLIIFDHPFIGQIAEEGLLIPLDKFLTDDFLQDQEKNSVGKSYNSYCWNSSTYALPIDVAGHVSARRPDLFAKYGLEVPETWNDVLLLAQETSHSNGSLVSIAGVSVDIWCFFVTLCANSGSDAYNDENGVISHDIGRLILEFIISLFKLSPKECSDWNPIGVLDHMSETDSIIYCPALFGYSNYARNGFRKSLVEFGSLATAGFGSIGGILGGAGIGVSSKTKFPKEAIEVAKILSSPEIQTGLYSQYGGQPAHKNAWISTEVNLATNKFFENTLETLENSYLRPRFPGFVDVQTFSSEVLWKTVHGQLSISQALSELDNIYISALKRLTP